MIIDWSIVLGMAAGLGVPGVTFTILAFRYVVHQEGRITVLESSRADDKDWRQCVDEKLAAIARDVNQIIGGARRG